MRKFCSEQQACEAGTALATRTASLTDAHSLPPKGQGCQSSQFLEMASPVSSANFAFFSSVRLDLKPQQNHYTTPLLITMQALLEISAPTSQPQEQWHKPNPAALPLPQQRGRHRPGPVPCFHMEAVFSTAFMIVCISKTSQSQTPT